MSQPRLYSLLATILWIIVALLIALNISAFFDLSDRHLVLVVTLAIGIVLLVSVNLSPAQHGLLKTRPRLDAGSKILLPASLTQAATSKLPFVPPLSPSKKDESLSVAVASAPAGKLSAEEARAWLDAFLVEQQKK
ncbi:MAG: hypothetical protein WEA04_00615 [Candidatus Andersenbacteria bacterium]